MQPTTEKYDPICLGCNYPLKQLDPSTRACPECARAFDPHDPSSFSTGRPVPDMLRRWIGAAPWVLPAIRWAVILALYCNIALAGGILASWVALGVLTGLVGCVYYIRKLLRFAIVVHYALPKELLAADRQRVARSRRIIGWAALLMLFRLPFYIAFLISLPWLGAHREYSVRPYDAPRSSHTMIGLFPIREVRVDYQCVWYETWLGGVLWYSESNDGKGRWKFFAGDDPLQNLPW